MKPAPLDTSLLGTPARPRAFLRLDFDMPRVFFATHITGMADIGSHPSDCAYALSEVWAPTGICPAPELPGCMYIYLVTALSIF